MRRLPRVENAGRRKQSHAQAVPQPEQTIRENRTMARKTPPDHQVEAFASTRSMAKFCSSTKAIAPTKAPIDASCRRAPR